MARANSSRPAVASQTPVRNSPIPKPAQRPSTPSPSGTPGNPPRQVTHEAIARRAYEIWQSGKGGTEFDNWVRAECELRGR
jgi:hypothetical protein